MEKILSIRFMLAVHLAIVAILVIAAAAIVNNQQDRLISELRSQIRSQHEILATLTIETDKNDTDETFAGLVKDCTARQRFEELLNKLTSLQRRELIELQQLFEDCGDFHAVRKSFLVYRLEREYEVLREEVLLLEEVIEDATLVAEVSAWGAIVGDEQKRSILLDEQVSLQREMISALLKGQRINSKELTEMITHTKSIVEELEAVDKQIDAIRSGLVT